MDLKSWNCYLEELVGAVERRRPVDPSQDPQFIDVKGLIKQQNTLDPQLWENEKLKPEIVDRLIQIAKKFRIKNPEKLFLCAYIRGTPYVRV